MTVKILGSGSATPLLGRHPTSLVLKHESRCFLLDCGEGTQWRLLEQEVKFSKINHIFISHLHGDHFLGLMGLLSTMHSLGRKNDLFLFAPPGMKEILTLQFKYQETRLDYKIILHETDTISSYILWEDETLVIRSIPLKHRISTCGFLINEKAKLKNLIKEKISREIKLQHIQLLKLGQDVFDDEGKLLYKNSDYTYQSTPSKSFAYCTDTKFDPELVPYIMNVDMLYHEATFLDDKEERAAQTFHSTAKQAATIAKQANVKKLIIGHFSSRYKILDAFLSDAKSIFNATELAEEGSEFAV